ncbi:hypothetical protein LCM10_12810 [Rossellomorea aquimaris]|uniref:hypothetical protein n=1 Tax=Rossellomorea aquimaris TaxID=189382 RepID=UPI001CD2A0C7|nr:hypothetical protein [Rossellomorea aquimaris]MCA1055871.1 hypothetical protein [Rossellomorea aquimaris]
MELRLTQEIKERFWYLFPFIMILFSLFNVFYGWELRTMTFRELEDYGELVYVGLVVALESALVTVFVLWVLGKIVKN